VDRHGTVSRSSVGPTAPWRGQSAALSSSESHHAPRPFHRGSPAAMPTPTQSAGSLGSPESLKQRPCDSHFTLCNLDDTKPLYQVCCRDLSFRFSNQRIHPLLQLSTVADRDRNDTNMYIRGKAVTRNLFLRFEHQKGCPEMDGDHRWCSTVPSPSARMNAHGTLASRCS
jgi:hypothetical protein